MALRICSADDGSQQMTDRGSAAVEAAIVFPALLLIGLLMYSFVTTMTARSQVQAAARAGARAAAVASSPAEARSRAESAATAALASGSSCQGEPSTAVSGFAAGEVVTVTVSCVSDPVFGHVVAPRNFTASASEAVSGIRGGIE